MKTTIDREYDNKHPLRVELERYRKEKLSEVVFRKVMRTFEQKNNQWVVSGTSMLDDWLNMSSQGQHLLSTISKDMDMKRDYYYENRINQIYLVEKNPYGQTKSQQNRIKNIYKTMKKQDTDVKQEYAQKRFNDFVNSQKNSNKPEQIKDTIYKSKSNNL